MQIMINIPKEFENHFNSDKFEDSLSRIKVDVLSCIAGSFSLSGLYEIETLDMLIKAFLNGTPIPKGHGDLKDIGKCDRKLFYQQCGGADSLITVKSAFDMLMSLQTIIETDKDGEDE